MKTILLAGVLAASLAGASAALADSGDKFAATTLDLSAEGVVRLPPDMATISLGVTSDAATAGAALAADAGDMTRVVAALRAAGIDPKDIQTSDLSLNPQYVYGQNQPPKLTGYQVTNQVTITVGELARLGPVVDAVVSAGATNVSQISFGLKSRAAAETEARIAAVKALDDKAAVYADAAGYHIKRLVSLSEGSVDDGGPPRAPMPMMAARAVATPIESGELEVSVSVNGEFELTR